MPLSQEDRDKVSRGFIRYCSLNEVKIPLGIKSTIADAIGEMDDWQTANGGNQININVGAKGYLNAPFKSWADNATISLLFSMVALMKYNEDALRRFFGRID